MNPYKIYKEIRAVGFKDWWWFVITLKGDEFNPKLNLINYWDGCKIDYKKLAKDRDKAHKIDNVLSDIIEK